MKKLILLTLFLSGVVKAEDNFFSLDKTTVDIAKNELIQVQYMMGEMSHINTEYKLYTDVTLESSDYHSSKIYLDVMPLTGVAYLEAPKKFSIPISLAVLDDAVFPFEKEEERELVINLYSSYNNEILLTETFEITIINSASSTSGNPTITDPSGTWFDRSLAGTGFYIMQYGNGTEIRYNGYSQDGQPLWLVSNVIDETWGQSEAKTFTMYEASPDANTNFNTPPLVVPGVAEWGSLQLQFDSCTTGSATLSGADGTQTLNLSKLANPINVSCVMQ